MLHKYYAIFYYCNKHFNICQIFENYSIFAVNPLLPSKYPLKDSYMEKGPSFLEDPFLFKNT